MTVELVEDLGIISGKRRGEYKCHCGQIYEARTDVVRYNDKHGKPNGCSRKCKKTNTVDSIEQTTPTMDLEIKYIKNKKEFINIINEFPEYKDNLDKIRIAREA